MKLAIVVALASSLGCSKGNPDCDRAVAHVINLTLVGEKPSAEEQSVIDQIKRQALGRCNDEGLSVAQRDCILAAKSLDERSFLTCPALAAKPPTWIIAPIGNPDRVAPPK